MLIETKKYNSSLKKLWADVFGDSEEYINLLFDYEYTPAECFGEIEDGQVISALYLLKCRINIGEKSYNGRYLYAAATLKSHRGKGIMGRLINEAEEYIKSENIDFISLVPASDRLYAYYEKFGFNTSMYNYFSKVIKDGDDYSADVIITDTDEFSKMRRKILDNSFHYEGSEMKYAHSCLKFAGYNVYKNTTDSYYIANGDKSEIIEYISSKKNLKENTEMLLSKLQKGSTIVSPYDLGDFCESTKQTYGMVYTAADELLDSLKDGIYMNIALD